MREHPFIRAFPSLEAGLDRAEGVASDNGVSGGGFHCGDLLSVRG